MITSSAQKDSSIALAKLLCKLDLVPAEAVTKVSEAKDVLPIALLARLKYCDEWKAIESIAAFLQLPVVRFNKENMADAARLLDDAHLASIDASRWTDMRAVPLTLKGGVLTLAVANPLDREMIASVSFDLDYKVVPCIGREEEILTVINRKVSEERKTDLKDLLLEGAAADGLEDSGELTLTAADHNAAPVVRVVNRIFSQAIDVNASDVHVNPEATGLQVRARVDGIMQLLFSIPRGMQSAVIARMKLLAGMDISERRKPQDGRMRLQSAQGAKDMRFSSVPTAHGENIVVRILATDLAHLTFESLGMAPEMLATFKRALEGSSRIILVTGPTGSGKSSSLYSALRYLNNGKRNIITVEDPIEYRIAGISQIQTNLKTGLTFAEGLRSILRQDPDVIMVGEIRDQETATIAIQAAQTGHLVLSTLHTNTAAAAITRLRDLGVPPFLISASLGCVVSQRLVRMLCEHCSKKGLAPLHSVPGLDPGNLREPVGCEHCSGAGYRGRTALFSLLPVDQKMREAIRDETGEEELEKLAEREGFKTLWQAAIPLLNDGRTSFEEAERILGPADKQHDLQGNSRSVKSAVAANASSGSVAGPLQKRKVLLVEDDDDVRSVLAMLLKTQLYDVAEAADGLDALEKVYESPPDLIVCDLMMPKLDGMGFIKRLRNDSRIGSIPVLVLTAASTDDNHLNSLEFGADDFISKTADSRILLAHVEKLLQKSAK